MKVTAEMMGALMPFLLPSASVSEIADRLRAIEPDGSLLIGRHDREFVITRSLLMFMFTQTSDELRGIATARDSYEVSKILAGLILHDRKLHAATPE